MVAYCLFLVGIHLRYDWNGSHEHIIRKFVQAHISWNYRKYCNSADVVSCCMGNNCPAEKQGKANPEFPSLQRFCLDNMAYTYDLGDGVWGHKVGGDCLAIPHGYFTG